LVLCPPVDQVLLDRFSVLDMMCRCPSHGQPKGLNR
jgi:hypothetical protein